MFTLLPMIAGTLPAGMFLVRLEPCEGKLSRTVRLSHRLLKPPDFLLHQAADAVFREVNLRKLHSDALGDETRG